MGPGNDMDAIPVSYIDTIGQMHDNSHGNNTYSTEHYDDAQFITMIEEWGHATEGNVGLVLHGLKNTLLG